MKSLIAGISAVIVATAAVTLFQESAAASGACESLRTLSLPNTTITVAESIDAGKFTLAGANPPPAMAAALISLPGFCRVAARIQPSADSDIKIEVWMPADGWNGKFEGVGNGGWSGAISYGPLANALRHGYAVASTDTGHSGGSGSFALGHPEKLIDFAYRAVHEMTVQGKAIVAAFYEKAPRLSYWSGCSSGGKQGLKEAQRFPDDYDGIVAGAPANYWTHLMTGSLWVGQATLKDPVSYIPKEKYALIHKAAVEACDAADGLKDGLIEDPTRCHFDPATLQCPGDETPVCLTRPQVEAVRKIYSPSKNPRSGAEIFPGLEPGSELGWGAMAGGPEPFPITADHYKYVVFKDPAWDFRTLDFDRDVARADQLDDGLLNATDPDLSRFFGHGGKLLLYHGWADQLIAPRNAINYYQSVVTQLGGPAKVAQSMRLFMVPGMGHCGGGEGPNAFDSLGALERWVEQGKPPDQLIASHLTNGAADRTRPICAYPEVAQYTGNGSPDEAASFTCKAP